MALSESKLLKNFKDIPDTDLPPGPVINNKIADKLSKIFAEYFSEAIANNTSPQVDALLLKNLLLSTINSSTFLEKLGSTIQQWALSWAWVGEKFSSTPGQTVAQGALLDVDLTEFARKESNAKANPPRDTLPDLVKKIHNWSSGGNIIVTMTNNESGATTPVPIF